MYSKLLITYFVLHLYHIHFERGQLKLYKAFQCSHTITFYKIIMSLVILFSNIFLIILTVFVFVASAVH